MYGTQTRESLQRHAAYAAEETQTPAHFPYTTLFRSAPANAYPKIMEHPGFPNGGGTGMLVKDYRGKNAEQEDWKITGANVTHICDVLNQAAMKEGQWTEKREAPGDLSIDFIRARLNE